MYGLSDQAKGMLRTRFSAVRQGSSRYSVAMVEGTLAQMFSLRGRWRSAGPLCPAGCSAGENEDEPIGCRLRAPHLARPAMELAHLGTSARDRDDGELLCRWIEWDVRRDLEIAAIQLIDDRQGRGKERRGGLEVASLGSHHRPEDAKHIRAASP